MPATQTTTLNRSWLVKLGIFTAVCLGFGIWGLADALWIYPARGREDASFKQKVYLEQLSQVPGGLGTASIADPVAKLAELESNRDALEKAEAEAAQGSGDAARLRQLAPQRAQYAAMEWLLSLKRISEMTPDRTQIPAARETLDTLNTKWKSASAPKPLAAYDLPLQWAFTFIGFGLAIYLLIYIMRSAGTKFGWDPATQTLFLPGGRELKPSDISEFDKRKWDKFFIVLNTKNGPPVKLDLLRFQNLEGWVLEMEKTAFPEQVKADDAGPTAEAPAPTA